MTLSVGADERRSKSVTNLSRSDALRIGAEPNNSSAGERWPDPHIDFHVNQQWGFWAISLLAHDVSATYYTSANAAGTCSPGVPAGVPLTTCGHPADRVGWVIMEGGELKLPALGPGDRIGYFAHYGQGTSAFSAGSVLTSAALFGSGNQAAVGWLTDGVYVNGSRIELTTSWTVAAGYEHFWIPTLSTSVFGAYTSINHDGAAKAFYAKNVCPSVAAGGQTGFNLASGPCDPDWQFIQVGTRVQWLPAPGWRLGIEGVYTRVFTAFSGAMANLAGTNTSATTGVVTAVNPVIGARPSGIYGINDQGTWAIVMRAQRNFNTASLQ
jgi:Porin subfamily